MVRIQFRCNLDYWKTAVMECGVWRRFIFLANLVNFFAYRISQINWIFFDDEEWNAELYRCGCKKWILKHSLWLKHFYLHHFALAQRSFKNQHLRHASIKIILWSRFSFLSNATLDTSHECRNLKFKKVENFWFWCQQQETSLRLFKLFAVNVLFNCSLNFILWNIFQFFN